MLIHHSCEIYFYLLNLLLICECSLRTCDTKLSDIYLEGDGISILNSELDSLIMYYSCNVFIFFKKAF